MPERKKTEAQIRAQKKYMENFVEIKVRMTADKRSTVQKHAANMGESATAFINRAIDETIDRDREHTSAAAEHQQSNQQDNSPDIANSKNSNVETLESNQQIYQQTNNNSCYASDEEIQIRKAQLLKQFNQLKSKEELKAQWQQHKK